MELGEVTTSGFKNGKRIPSGQQRVSYAASLFDAIDRNDLQNFRLLLDSSEGASGLEILHNGNHTLLQYVCVQHDRHEFADELLRREISPNATGPKAYSTPFLLAAEHGRHLVLKMLLCNKDTDLRAVDFHHRKETALHKVVLMQHGADAYRDYVECLDLLLGSMDENEGSNSRGLHLNAVDESGNTPLHYAAARLNHGGELEEVVVLKLLRAGSDIGIKNKQEEPAFRRIPADLLESFMDECITANEKASFEKDFKITFWYKFLVPSSSRPDCVTGTFNRYVEEPLLMISGSEEHRRLLKHPILASCIYMMWFRIRWIFFINFSIYAVYVVLMTFYILELIDSRRRVWTFLCNSPLMPTVFYVFCVKELIHIFMSGGKYVRIPVNLPKILLMPLSGFLLWVDVGMYVTSQIATLVVLLMWIELALLLGQHPRFTTYIIMFRTVSVNFFFFIAVYSMFIVAFALSFYILFHNEATKTQPSLNDSYDYFIDPLMTLIKTVLMMLGEFELSTIPLETSPILSYAVFSAFLLLIAVVLINLLNGLAVSDTHAIMEKAEFVGYVSQIEVFSQMEAMMLDFPRLFHLCSCCFARKGQPCRLKRFGPWGKSVDLGICGWTHVFWKWKKVEVLVNQGGLMHHCFCLSCCPQCIHRTMDKRVLKRAVEIALNKRKVRTIDDIWRRLDHIENLMKKMVVPVARLAGPDVRC